MVCLSWAESGCIFWQDERPNIKRLTVFESFAAELTDELQLRCKGALAFHHFCALVRDTPLRAYSMNSSKSDSISGNPWSWDDYKPWRSFGGAPGFRVTGEGACAESRLLTTSMNLNVQDQWEH